MFIQATAGVDVDPDELAVENGPSGENKPERENKDVGGGERIMSTSVRYFNFVRAILISLQLLLFE